MVMRQEIDVRTTVEGKSIPAGVASASNGNVTFRYDSG